VMTGVTDVDTLIRADAIHRPTHVCLDLRGLLEVYVAPTTDGGSTSCGGWTFIADDTGVRLTESGNDPELGLRALAVASWEACDRGASAGSITESDAAKAVKEALAVGLG